MSKIIERIKERAKLNKKTIVLPETMDRRVLEATEIILKEDLADIILVGKEEEILKLAEGLVINKAIIIILLLLNLQKNLYKIYMNFVVKKE